MESKELIVTVMKKANKPLKTSEIASLANIDVKDVEKIMKKLKTEDRITSPIRCFWILK